MGKCILDVQGANGFVQIGGELRARDGLAVGSVACDLQMRKSRETRGRQRRQQSYCVFATPLSFVPAPLRFRHRRWAPPHLSLIGNNRTAALLYTHLGELSGCDVAEEVALAAGGRGVGAQVPKDVLDGDVRPADAGLEPIGGPVLAVRPGLMKKNRQTEEGRTNNTLSWSSTAIGGGRTEQRHVNSSPSGP